VRAGPIEASVASATAIADAPISSSETEHTAVADAPILTPVIVDPNDETPQMQTDEFLNLNVHRDAGSEPSIMAGEAPPGFNEKTEPGASSRWLTPLLLGLLGSLTLVGVYFWGASGSTQFRGAAAPAARTVDAGSAVEIMDAGVVAKISDATPKAPVVDAGARVVIVDVGVEASPPKTVASAATGARKPPSAAGRRRRRRRGVVNGDSKARPVPAAAVDPLLTARSKPTSPQPDAGVAPPTEATPDAGKAAPAVKAQPEAMGGARGKIRVTEGGGRVGSSTAVGPGGWRPVADRGLLFRLQGGGLPVFIRLRDQSGRFLATINARPWGKVEIDGRNVGNTPLGAVPLTTGKHRIRVTGKDGVVKVVLLELAR
jgi:hypothetical protein